MNSALNPEELRAQGFERVERDDRLLDVFSKETPEKGVTLWVKWNADAVEIIRMHNAKTSRHTFPRAEIDQALVSNRLLELM